MVSALKDSGVDDLKVHLQQSVSHHILPTGLRESFFNVVVFWGPINAMRVKKTPSTLRCMVLQQWAFDTVYSVCTHKPVILLAGVSAEAGGTKGVGV